MQRHRVKFDVKGLWAKQDKDISEVYKQCRKTLPHVDTLLTERLKGQTAVTTSLIQALFSEIKATLKVDMSNASNQLHELGVKTDLLETLLLDIVTDHFTERIAMYAVCGCTLFMCCVTVFCIYKLRKDIMARIDQVISQGGVRLTEREPFIPQASFSFANSGVTPPVSNWVLALQSQL